MTLLEVWDDPRTFRRTFQVNRCLDAYVTDHEMRRAGTHPPLSMLGAQANAIALLNLQLRAAAPLVWLAMPGHEDSTSARKKAQDG